MLPQITLLFAIVAWCFLLAILVFILDKEKHPVLAFLALAFFILSLVLIPRTVLDDNNNCDIVIANSSVTGNSTHYNTTFQYSYFCNAVTKTTASTFFKTVMWFIRLFFVYALVYMIYLIGTFWTDYVRKKGGFK